MKLGAAKPAPADPPKADDLSTIMCESPPFLFAQVGLQIAFCLHLACRCGVAVLALLARPGNTVILLALCSLCCKLRCVRMCPRLFVSH
jgi:hypothetical protein